MGREGGAALGRLAQGEVHFQADLECCLAEAAYLQLAAAQTCKKTVIVGM